MSEKMVRTQVYLPRDIYEELKMRASKSGSTMAVQIREALAEYVTSADTKKGQTLADDDLIWNLIGIGESGISDGSVNHDKYIYARDWDTPKEPT